MAVKSETGYSISSSGLIRQWGVFKGNSGVWTTVPLPYACPNAILNIVASVSKLGSGSGADSAATVQRNGSRNSFLVGLKGGSTSWNIEWNAICH